jgi:hypothetical protein
MAVVTEETVTTFYFPIDSLIDKVNLHVSCNMGLG